MCQTTERCAVCCIHANPNIAKIEPPASVVRKTLSPPFPLPYGTISQDILGGDLCLGTQTNPYEF